jgi:hypothetical protein
VQELLTLLQDAGHTDFRDARGPMGFTQRQAAGKFTQPLLPTTSTTSCCVPDTAPADEIPLPILNLSQVTPDPGDIPHGGSWRSGMGVLRRRHRLDTTPAGRCRRVGSAGAPGAPARWRSTGRVYGRRHGGAVARAGSPRRRGAAVLGDVPRFRGDSSQLKRCIREIGRAMAGMRRDDAVGSALGSGINDDLPQGAQRGRTHRPRRQPVEIRLPTALTSSRTERDRGVACFMRMASVVLTTAMALARTTKIPRHDGAAVRSADLRAVRRLGRTRRGSMRRRPRPRAS